MSTSSAVQLFWLPVLIAPLCVVAAIVGPQLVRRRSRPVLPRSAPLSQRAAPLTACAEIDVAAETKTILERLGTRAKRQFVSFITGIEPGLTAHGDAAVFRQVVGDLLETALRRAPCGTVLITGTRVGSRAQICITDDSKADAFVMSESVLCEIAQLVGQQGGTLDIDAQPGEGTVVTVRLPAGQGSASRSQAAEPRSVVTSPA